MSDQSALPYAADPVLGEAPARLSVRVELIEFGIAADEQASSQREIVDSSRGSHIGERDFRSSSGFYNDLGRARLPTLRSPHGLSHIGYLRSLWLAVVHWRALISRAAVCARDSAYA